MATMVQYTLGEHRGVSRLWIEGKRLVREGFTYGARLRMAIEDGRLTLRVLEAHETGHSVRVSRRKTNETPLFEIRDNLLAGLFGRRARVVVKFMRGRMTITKHHLDERRTERETALMQRLTGGEALRVASLYHGGGVIDSAIHEGLSDAGVSSYCALASEIEPAYLEASLANNPHLFRDDSLILNAPIEQLNFAHALRVGADLLVAGIPCTGASKAGKAKNRIKHAEQHASAGAQFYAVLRMVEVLNPAIVLVENVVGYRDTAGYAVLVSTLATLGYRIDDCALNGNDHGVLENRDRLAMVAVSDGLAGFDLSDVVPVATKPANVAAILEPAEAVDALWKDYGYLRDKEARDKASGKGFHRQIVTPEAERVGTIGRGYAKIRSTEPQLQHPTDPLLTRLFSVLEHARLKGIPARIVEGLSTTVAHEVLGQSVVYPAFRAVGRALGRWLAALSPARTESPAALAA